MRVFVYGLLRFLRRHQRWLLCLALAFPAIFLPHYRYSGISRTRYSLGWPFYGMDILIQAVKVDEVDCEFQPNPLLLLLAVGWTWGMNLALHGRRWALAENTWVGALAQAPLTSLYGILVFVFLDGWVGFVWERHLYPMHWPELERAYRTSHDWLAFLYGFGLLGTLVALYADAKPWTKWQRLPHLGCACGILWLAWWYVPAIDWKLDMLEEGIRIAQKQQQKSSH